VYSYLLAVFLAGSTWVILYFAKSFAHQKMWKIGLLLAPFAVLDVITVPVYWSPITLFNFPVGIEGFLFTFFITGIASSLYDISKPRQNAVVKLQAKLLLPLMVPAIYTLLVVLYFKLNPIYLFIIGFLSMGMVIVCIRKDLFWGALRSSVLFGILYISVFTIWLLLIPSNIDWWNSVNLSGLHVGLVPFEEVLFAFSLGVFVGPLYDYLTNNLA
jgi:hypothetical protein